MGSVICVVMLVLRFTVQYVSFTRLCKHCREYKYVANTQLYNFNDYKEETKENE